MIKNKSRVIDLNGPEGNAFILMGYAEQYAKEVGKDSEKIIDEMKSDDYENLIRVFNREFGDYVDLVRNEWD